MEIINWDTFNQYKGTNMLTPLNSKTRTEKGLNWTEQGVYTHRVNKGTKWTIGECNQ